MELIKQAGHIYITKTKKTEIEKIDFAVCAQPTQTLEKYYNAQSRKPAILINGGFFNMSNGETVFDYINEHKQISSANDLVYGFGIDNLGNIKYGKDTDNNWKDFISAYPPLVVNGQKQKPTFASEINYNARRTILGYDDNYIYTISIDNPGVNFDKAADIALNIGCKYAINLDGGGSTRLLYEGKAYARAIYNRPIDNIVAIYVKKQEPITPTEQYLYRVQLGAFSSKANADNYCKVIQSLGTNYKGAFVKFIAPYYKVQVGAFSIKQNADNMVKDLKAKGYNAFIVSEKKTESGGLTNMSNSPLVEVTMLSPNNSGTRKQKIDRISPHCVVGQCTAESLGAWFAKSSTQASSNYGIDKDGRVGLYVDESKRSWCTSSNANDQRAVTIECASDTTDPYRMNDVVYQKLILLCADICRRNGKTKLLWFNDKNYALNYQPKDNEMLITVHRWFANKPCPGDWLYSRLGDLANQVTARLQPAVVTPTTEPQQEEDEMTQEKFNEMMNTWLEQQAAREPSDWSKKYRDWAESNQYIQGDEKGRKMYKKLLTREEVITLLYRIMGGKG